MTNTLATAPATFAQVIDTYTDALLAELLAGADTCSCCGLPQLASALGTPTHNAWVDTDLRAIHAPHDWAHVTAFLAHAPLTQLDDGRFRVGCRSDVEALSVANHLKRLGTPASAITIGGSA